MKLKPWHKIEGFAPRENIREGRGLDTAEFAVHLDQVRDGTATDDYRDPQRFFERTYLTRSLLEFAVEVVRRLSGMPSETNAIFNAITEFGGGKTHALTLSYHLANSGPDANAWPGVGQILREADLESIPKAQTAIFVGTEFDPLKGRGGDDGTPLRKTPWGEIAYQLGGEESFKIVATHDAEFVEPKGDVIRAMLPDRPCLILMDEVLSHISSYRRYGYHDRFYNFLQSLTETVRGRNNVVLVVSIPKSAMEYTADDEADQQRLKKLLDRLGKAITLSAGSETAEIIRRRLFDWDPKLLDASGKLFLPRDAVTTCQAYADWALEHRQQIATGFPVDQARATFESTYPFHPALLSVFERKWQTIPRFQRTRGILRMLALWIAHAYREDHKKTYRDPLITLGTAPFEDVTFRSAIFEQLGDDRLLSAVTADIAGKADSHAIRLDAEATEAVKQSRLHRKIATTIFFESNGGCTRAEATLPEIRLSVGEPDLDTGNIETVLETFADACYYFNIDKNKYRFSLTPNLNKILADRRASVSDHEIETRMTEEVKAVFVGSAGLTVNHFPKAPKDIPNRPVLVLVVLSPDQTHSDPETLNFADRLIRSAGSSDRTYKSCLIFALSGGDQDLRTNTRKLLAWESIQANDAESLDENLKRQLKESLAKAKRDVSESVWRTYRYIALLGRENQLKETDLGLVTSSQASSIPKLILDRLRQGDELLDHVTPRFLIRNWSPAFEEWSLRSIRDAFYASPLFPRLMNQDILKTTIAQGIADGAFACVGKENDRYDPFQFKTRLNAQDIEFADDLYLIQAEAAETYLKRIADPPHPKTLILNPSSVQLHPGEQQSFSYTCEDQHGDPFNLAAHGYALTWTAQGGQMSFDGLFTAGDNSGNYRITATVDTLSASSTVRVIGQVTEPFTGEKTASETVPDSPANPTSFTWTGAVTPQKWMTFYSKVMTKVTNKTDITVNLSVKAEMKGELTEPLVEELKSALQELALDGDIQVQ